MKTRTIIHHLITSLNKFGKGDPLEANPFNTFKDNCSFSISSELLCLLFLYLSMFRYLILMNGKDFVDL